MREMLDKICNQEHLNSGETKLLFSAIVKGELDPVQISALLVGLRTKGESPDEIAGAAQALRESAKAFPKPDYALADCCGTGGDGSNTINISTAVALVAAEMGIPMAKHGNRSISSKCGSADLLEELGVKIDSSPEVSRRCLDEVGICFLFAPQYHSGLRHAMPIRNALKIRTVFNILGPLVNPACPSFQIIGVYDPKLCQPLAKTLGLLGCQSAMVVHGSGLDEMALHGNTKASFLANGEVVELNISPEETGVSRFAIESLRGGDPKENAKKIANLLKGNGDEAHVAAVAINAGALAYVSGKAVSIKAGTDLALRSIRSGKSFDRLQRWAELSHGA